MPEIDYDSLAIYFMTLCYLITCRWQRKLQENKEH